jgi:glutamate-ammonia-ligase adenylyltransferase
MDLFPEAETLSSRAGNLVFTGVEPEPETLDTLSRLGFERGPEVWREMADWLGGRVRATRSERAREYLTALAPQLIDYCADTKQPDRAFYAFARFFTNVSGGVSLLSMFAQAPTRLEQLVSIMVRSPHVADMLAARPAILDAMSDPRFLNLDLDLMAEAYMSEIHHAGDFEGALNAARRLVREDHFRVTVGLLTGQVSPDLAPLLFTKIADQTVSVLMPSAIKECQIKGFPIEGDMAVLALGKMGGKEMNLMSDLDIMLIYRPGPEDKNAQRNYGKVTQRLVSALSVVTEEGGLFEVDMALRPSGRSGPVAVDIDAFTSYYAEHAWTWEFMALSRARVVAATSHTFADDLTRCVRQAMISPRSDLNMPQDIANMLDRVKQEKKARGFWDVKNMDGGLRDIEFIAQAQYLRKRDVFSNAKDAGTEDMLKLASLSELVTATQKDSLISTMKFYHHLSQYISITLGAPASHLGEDAFEPVAKLMGFKDVSELKTSIDKHAQTVRALTQAYIYAA